MGKGHRVAIFNNGIIAFENGHVVFKCRDYCDSNKEKVQFKEVIFLLNERW